GIIPFIGPRSKLPTVREQECSCTKVILKIRELGGTMHVLFIKLKDRSIVKTVEEKLKIKTHIWFIIYKL
ncbi:hypothetical protein L9F63_023363, partial [Diploptera punctata]